MIPAIASGASLHTRYARAGYRRHRVTRSFGMGIGYGSYGRSYGRRYRRYGYGYRRYGYGYGGYGLGYRGYRG